MKNQKLIKSLIIKNKEKRFKAACAAIQGLTSKYTLNTPEDQEIICKLAFELADELLKQE